MKNVKRILLLLVVVWVVFGAQAQIFYRVSGNGLNEPSYLFGTHHLASLSVIDSVGAREALDAAKAVVGEIDMTQDQMALAMQMQKHQLAPSDSTLTKVLGQEKMKRYAPIFSEYALMPGMQLQMLDAMKPMVVNIMVTMGMINKTMPEFKPDEQLDTYFQQEAKKAGKEILSLETADQQAAILYDMTPIAEQAKTLCEVFDKPEKVMVDARKLNIVYAAGNLDAMLEMTKTEEVNPQFFEALLFNRNANWMKQLPKMMAQRSCFIAVGALHLAGERGIVNLLRKGGYTVEAIKGGSPN